MLTLHTLSLYQDAAARCQFCDKMLHSVPTVKYCRAFSWKRLQLESIL